MKRRPSTRRAIAELLALWVGTTLALAAVFFVYHLAGAEPIQQPNVSRSST